MRKWEAISLVVQFHEPAGVMIRTPVLAQAEAQPFVIERADGATKEATTLAAYDLVTLAVALDDLGVAPGEIVSFQLKVLQAGIERECYPESAPLQFALPGEDWELARWVV